MERSIRLNDELNTELVASRIQALRRPPNNDFKIFVVVGNTSIVLDYDTDDVQPAILDYQKLVNSIPGAICLKDMEPSVVNPAYINGVRFSALSGKMFVLLDSYTLICTYGPRRSKLYPRLEEALAAVSKVIEKGEVPCSSPSQISKQLASEAPTLLAK